jgi:NitT/TauT family transport system permease protein
MKRVAPKKHFLEVIHTVAISNWIKIPFLKGRWADVFILLLLAFLGFGFILYAKQFAAPLQTKVDINLSPSHLPKYAFFSLSRVCLAYLVSFVFSLIWGYWSAKDRKAEKVLIPLLDVFQSIPILGFMPGLVLALVAFFPMTNEGLELAAILMIFTSQAWNMAFGVYHSIRTIPQEQMQCAAFYKFTGFQRFRWLELPCSAISLIWNSIMSVAGGWFFLMLSEAFRLGSKDFRLPGLGSYISVAADQGDILAMCYAIVMMILLIILLDQLVWRPLIVWSQKFRFEAISSTSPAESWFLNVLKSSFLISQAHAFFLSFKIRLKIPEFKASLALWISRIGLVTLLCLIAVACFYLFDQLKGVTLDQWLLLFQRLGLTFGRVMLCLVISTLLAVPIGLMIGLSKTLSSKLEPILQVAASFPGSLLFPALLWFFSLTKISLGFGSVILMLAGTGWYVLFNVIAGVNAIPSDLREVAKSFQYSRLQRFRWLHIPGIFPYLLTGIVTASGGAWNVSIVAEYISYNGQVRMTPGIGSSISLAAQEGNIPFLIASVLVMVFVVALWNYQVWLRLYHYSEKRFSLNY